MTIHTKVPKSAFTAGILDENFHARLLAGLPKWAAIAGIPPQYVWTKLSDYCTGDDLEWVRTLKTVEGSGMVYTGTNHQVPVGDKMMAIAGACLRNYVDARFMPVQTILTHLKDGDMPDATVVLVPNFCMAHGEVSSVAPWEPAALLGWLYSRMTHNHQTVLYVGNMKTLEATYGEAIAAHLNNHFHIL